ncbi:MAG: putative kinesin motor domain protein, partial [Streblomastix strix]
MRRKMASTDKNIVSSRSHAIFQIKIQSRLKNNNAQVEGALCGKLNLIDLAGSERAEGNNNTGIRMLEGANINRSLLALGNCINALSIGSHFVPYRDSKLTRLLKDSLGGNTKTVMIATLSVAASCYEESLNTLRYAARAKNIIKPSISINRVTANDQIQHYKDIIGQLKSEIDNLKEQLR